MSLGVGNITTHQKKEQAGAPFAPGSAVNGVSLDALSRIVLGNTAGATDAILLDDREIPLAAFSLMFVDNVAGASLGAQSTNVPGVLSFGLRFIDANIGGDITQGMDPITGGLFMEGSGSGIKQFLYLPGNNNIFQFSDGVAGGAGGAVVAVQMALGGKATGIFVETQDENFSLLLVLSNPGANPMGALMQSSVNGLPSSYIGLFGPTYAEVALQNGCGIDTDVGPATFWMNFSNRSLNGAGYRWFHQIGLGAATQTMEFENPGRLGIRVSGPQGAVHLPAGLAAVSGAPIALTAGVAVQTVLEDDRVNYDGSLLYLSNGGVNYIIPKTLTEVATLDFPNTAAGASSDLTIAVAGAADGDPVVLGTPNAATAANGVFTAWVSAANTVTVRFTNTNLVAAIDPASADFRVSVLKY